MRVSKKSSYAFITGTGWLISGKSLAELPPRDALSFKERFVVSFFRINRDKSLRHDAMVAKFPDDKKPKRHLKSGFALFQTSSIFFKFV